MNQKQTELYIKATLGYVTSILYIVIIGLLAWYSPSSVEHPEHAVYIISAGAAINFISATIVIRYGNINDKDLSWNITRLAVAHTPTIITLLFATMNLFL